MQLKIFFWWFYHFLGPNNGISLGKHDFLNFLYFLDRLHYPINFFNSNNQFQSEADFAFNAKFNLLK